MKRLQSHSIVCGALLVHLLLWAAGVRAQSTQPAQPRDGVSGVVKDEDGRPVKGATVLLVGAGEQAYIESGAQRADMRASHATRKTDDTGSFSFPRGEGEYWLVALDEKAGCAEMLIRDEPDAPVHHSMFLSPWGRIEGVARRGAEPFADQTVSYQWLHGILADWNNSPLVQFGGYSKTDADGKFAFEQVPPGVNQVSLVIAREIAKHRFVQSSSHPSIAYVQPGETAHVTIGGTGRPVVGRIVAEGVTDWSPFQTSLAYVPMPEGGPTEQNLLISRAATRSFCVDVKADGTFRAEDVPSGQYSLMLVNWPVFDQAEPDQPQRPQTYYGQITVPPLDQPRSDEALDVGDVPVEGS